MQAARQTRNTKQHRVLVIGAAGEMVRVAVSLLARYEHDRIALTLCDIDAASLKRTFENLPGGSPDCRHLDLFDERALRDAVTETDLVLLGAGPYYRTAAPVMEACLELGVDYLDFDDDVESTKQALDLDSQAQKAKVAFFKGCGASPGLTNVFAADAAAQLDEVDGLDVAWCTGDEGPQQVGRAVVEHLIHIASGPCVIWRDGREQIVPSYARSEIFPLSGELGPYRLYEIAHPEAVMLPRTYPHLHSARCLGALHPQPVNGVVRGVAQAVTRELLPREVAISFFQEVQAGRTGPSRAWRFALKGMIDQVRNGESDVKTLARFVAKSALRSRFPYRGGLAARATGMRGGKRVSVLRRGAPRPGTAWDSMSETTGRAIAASVRLALDPKTKKKGVLFPEAWIEPEEFYRALEAQGALRSQIIEEFLVQPAPGPRGGN